MRQIRRFRAPFISKDQIAAEAEGFRAKYPSCSSFPIDILAVAEFDVGLEFDFKLLRNLEQDALLLSDFKTLVVDKSYFFDRRYDARLRFSIAHELGHLVLHKGIYGRVHFDTEQQWIKFVESVPADQYHWVEWQANEFAGRLLVPTKRLRPAFEESMEDAESEGYYSLGEEAVLDFICSALCPNFGVSRYVIRSRLGSDRLWIPGQMLGPF